MSGGHCFSAEKAGAEKSHIKADGRISAGNFLSGVHPQP